MIFVSIIGYHQLISTESRVQQCTTSLARGFRLGTPLHRVKWHNCWGAIWKLDSWGVNLWRKKWRGKSMACPGTWLELGHYVTQMLRGKLRIGARKVADAWVCDTSERSVTATSASRFKGICHLFILSTGMLLICSVLEHRVPLNILVCPLSVAGIYILSRDWPMSKNVIWVWVQGYS